MANYNISVEEYLEKMENGEIDYADFISKYMEEIKKADSKFNFLNTVNNEKSGQPKEMLFGLPFSVKDDICVKGMQANAGSRILEGYIPPFDATSVDKIKQNSGFIAGKTSQDEFGFGTFSTNSGYKIPKNPLDPARTAGGSSGGAASIISAIGMPQIAISESTGGSTTAPAAFCGVAGLTPTYGLVSRYGLIDYASTLDKICVTSRSVYDIALSLSVIAGHDPKDSTSINKKAGEYRKNLGIDFKKLKIGIPKEYMQDLDKKIGKSVWDAIKKMESLGAEYSEVSLPHTKYSIATYYIIATSEASTNLAKFSGMRYGAEEEIKGNFNEYFSEIRTEYFGEEAKRRILLGTFARMAGYRDQYYIKAMKVRTLIIQDFKKAFSKFDVLVSPSMPVIAPKFTEIERLTPLENYMMDILTVAPNLAGIPMLTVPCGKVDGMPVGLHILGDHLQEQKVLQVGYEFERN